MLFGIRERVGDEALHFRLRKRRRVKAPPFSSPRMYNDAEEHVLCLTYYIKQQKKSLKMVRYVCMMRITKGSGIVYTCE